MEQLGNDFQTALASPIADGVATAIAVVSGVGAPAPNFRIRVDNELMLVTSVGAGTNWTVTRGIESSTPVAHAAGAPAIMVMTAGGYNQWLTDSLAAAGFALAATTLAGYGITDAYTKTAGDARYLAIAGTAANSSQLLGATWAAPGAIGGTTPAAGTFTPLTVGASGTQVIMQCDAANVLSLRNGANAQSCYIYGTFTDLSNYERGLAGWSSGTFVFGSESAGTGTARNTQIKAAGTAVIFLNTNATNRWQVAGIGTLSAVADNSYDFGGPSNRARDGYFGRNLFVTGGVGLKVKAGAIVDGDFTSPVDGFLAADSTNSKLWVRLGGAWKSVTVA